MRISDGLSAREVMDMALSERQFQGWVTAAARIRGFHSYHTHDSRRSDKGWPDLVLVKAPRLLIVELKKQSGKVSPAQRWWLDELTAVATSNNTIEVYEWRPSDAEEILEVLSR